MLRGSEVVGHPVITHDGGKKVGEVKDLVIDRGGSVVLGLLLDEGGWFKHARVVAWPAIQVIGPDAVIIDSDNSVVKASEAPDMKDVLERGHVLLGRRVQTHDGRDLGKMEAVFFNASSGAVEGFELSGGLAADSHSGRAFLPASRSFQAGEDVAFVDPSAADTLQDMKKMTASRK